MKTLGYWVLAAGIVWLLVAVNMDTSVPTGLGGRVNNIGLIAQKQNYMLMGAFVALCGLLMAIFGKSKKEGASTIKCPYCAEPIQKEAIKCKHCGSDVKSALSEQQIVNFKPTDMAFDEFFIRGDNDFTLNKASVDLLISRMKKANPNIHPTNIKEKYQGSINELVNQLPSKIQQEFFKYYSSKI